MLFLVLSTKLDGDMIKSMLEALKLEMEQNGNVRIAVFSRHSCCMLSTDLVLVDCQNLLPTSLLQVVSTSYNKFANDQLQQA